MSRERPWWLSAKSAGVLVALGVVNVVLAASSGLYLTIAGGLPAACLYRVMDTISPRHDETIAVLADLMGPAWGFIWFESAIFVGLAVLRIRAARPRL
jgi:hypothetical protein